MRVDGVFFFSLPRRLLNMRVTTRPPRREVCKCANGSEKEKVHYRRYGYHSEALRDTCAFFLCDAFLVVILILKFRTVDFKGFEHILNPSRKLIKEMTHSNFPEN